ncbi:MAG: thioredoxin [Patescibacteria group bacterium]
MQPKFLKSDLPILVDFYAPWCGPCQMMAPILDELSDDLAGKVKIAKINTEENMEIAMQYQIASIPNMKLFKDGKMIQDFIGYRMKDQFKQEIEQALK